MGMEAQVISGVVEVHYLRTEAAITAIEELLETILSDKSNMDDFCASIDKHLIQLERSVIARWHERVEDDYSKNPFLVPEY